jgi:hypothetical protein
MSRTAAVLSLRLSSLSDVAGDELFYASTLPILVGGACDVRVPTHWIQIDLNDFVTGDPAVRLKYAQAASYESSVDIVVVDMMVGTRRTGFHGSSGHRHNSVLTCIEAIVEALGDSQTLVVFTELALDELELNAWPGMWNRFRAGRLVGLSRSNTEIGCTSRLSVGDRKALGVELAARTPDPLEQLDRKLIRQIGLFRSAAEGQVSRFYYDGRFAAHELSKLIAQHFERRRVTSLVCDSSSCHWIAKPCEAAARDLGIEWIDLANDDPPVGGIPALVLPMIVTGLELERQLTLLGSAAENVKVLAVLRGLTSQEAGNLRPAIPTTAKRATIALSNSRVDFCFLLNVVQERESMGRGLFSVGAENYPSEIATVRASLSGAEFYQMVDYFGLRDTANLGRTRAGNLPQKIPNFEEAFQVLGAWIAVKMFGLVVDRIDDPENGEKVLVVFPAKPDGPRLLTDSMQAIFGVDIVMVEDINDAGWIDKIRSSNAQTVAFMDEFCFEGITAASVVNRIVESFASEAVAACVADMKGPGVARSVEVRSLFQTTEFSVV